MVRYLAAILGAMLLTGCAGSECHYTDSLASAIDAYCEATTAQEADEARAAMLNVLEVEEVRGGTP